jgi:hypothetical protein
VADASASVTVTVSFEDGGGGGGGGGSGSGANVTLTDSVATTENPSTTTSSSITYTYEQTLENSQTLTYTENLQQSRTVTLEGGFLKVPAIVVNRGNLAFKVSNVVLSATFLDPDGTVIAVQNLFIDEGMITTFVPFALAAGETQGPSNFVSLDLTMETVYAILARSHSLQINLAIYEIDDAKGVPYSFDIDTVGAKTALLVIDYGKQRQPELYQVATNWDPAHPGSSAAQIFGDILHIPFTADSENGLTSVRDVSMTTSGGKAWHVQHMHKDGPDFVDDPDYKGDGGYDFDDIEVHAGDVLHLAFSGPGAPVSWDGGPRNEPLVTGPRGDAGAVISADGGVPSERPQIPQLPEGGPTLPPLTPGETPPWVSGGGAPASGGYPPSGGAPALPPPSGGVPSLPPSSGDPSVPSPDGGT